ncbi:MAG: hypothetical protein OEY43_00495 [Gammaproteobacteria bacterium]|nr:hypothetical protein [Gammaproteobacteria bacterium]
MSGNLHAESKIIQVYGISQTYWDVKPGDTLGEIMQQLLPRNRFLRKPLMEDIVAMNPQAFINNDPARMRANQRLWLPNHTAHLRENINSDRYAIQQFSWGYLQRLK